MGASSAVPTGKKAMARVALVDLDRTTGEILRDCFKQFSIEAVPLAGEQAERLRKEKFEGAVLTLDSNAGVILEMARTSASNSRIVIFGIAGSIQEAMRFSKYGINAVIDKPVERQAALRVIRGTHLLVLNELRRYVRVPMVTSVNIETGSGKVTATTCEVSAGGMSLRTRGKLALMQEVEVGFDLPEALDLKVRATVCWVRPAEEMIGIRFDRMDEQRQRVREWIDYYLGL